MVVASTMAQSVGRDARASLGERPASNARTASSQAVTSVTASASSSGAVLLACWPPCVHFNITESSSVMAPAARGGGAWMLSNRAHG
jgi:hypothetical protein